jgi:signal transduction histidine kinase
MKLHAIRPLRGHNLDLLGQSLSARVLWLTVGIILLVEVAILMPSLGREREAWLDAHITQAHLAAFSAAQSSDGQLDGTTRDSLLALSDVQSIRLIEPGRTIEVSQGTPLPPPQRVVYLAQETLLEATWRADIQVIGIGPRELEVIAPSPLQESATLDIRVDGHELAQSLRSYTAHIAALSVIIALVTGLLVFAALDRLLVRPMRILTASIVGFREAPELDGQGDLIWLAQRRDDEISGAARELKSMQDEMRATLWRNARLAAVGTAVAKISHDLRNILSSALLVADRLQESEDPIAKRAARTLIPAVERAAQLVSRTVDFAREGPPPITRSAVVVSELIDEAAQMLRPEETGVRIENLVSDNLVLALDRDHIYRVLVNLMRNAAEAGADRITLSVDSKAGVSRMWVTDNGPGLPLRVQDNLFRPFTGSGRHGGTGLGLTIARDLIRAHGGDLVLSQTGPLGTVFIMELVVSEAATLTQQDYARPLAELMPLPPTPPAPEPVPVAAAAPTPHPRRSPKPRRKKPAVADVPVPAAGELQAALPLAGASSAKVAARRTKPPERPAAPPAAPEPMPPLHPDLADLPGAHRRVH